MSWNFAKRARRPALSRYKKAAGRPLSSKRSMYVLNR